MAVGVPVVATPDAVYGMELHSERGLLIGVNAEEMANQALRLLRDCCFAEEQSVAAHAQVSQSFDFSATYGRLASELDEWLEAKRALA
jgi:glycosyltransferase involved in cell wall biosynthesis